MANPDQIDVLEGVVTKVATNVTAGTIRNLSRDVAMFFTTRTTGGAAPNVSEMSAEMSLMFAEDGVNEYISNGVPIDIYVMSPNDNGSIRVDLP